MAKRARGGAAPSSPLLLSVLLLCARAARDGRAAEVPPPPPPPPVHCEECDSRALSTCVTPTGCELVKEPGCGCCLTCARLPGQPCGVYTERCGAGQLCIPAPGEIRPLQALLEGRGVCRNASLEAQQPASATEATQDPEGPWSAEAEPTSPEPPPGDSLSRSRINNERERQKLLQGTPQRHRERTVQGAPERGSTGFAVGAGGPRLQQQGPCRKFMDNILENLKTATRPTLKGVRIPNCDRRGFFKKKQCNPSRGRHRGICWCVDKYGTHQPGSESQKGDVHCPNMEGD
ncbi:insulin-like growth factor-binding protein 5 [Petromyzon marinus]|uniref:insulin-like growth factor-binding protein 5 n=1 Tax=Petromyzon marinus TaxID=7757 RepID=UPI003F6F15A4